MADQTLSGQEKLLVEKARAARKKAYAPYSSFRVGAALLAEDGRLFTAGNVENASYGLTLCAERSAVVKAVSEGADRFTAIAIVADSAGPCSPCGACRQVLREFAPALKVIMANLEGHTLVMSLSELLPLSFGRERLDSQQR